MAERQRTISQSEYGQLTRLLRDDQAGTVKNPVGGTTRRKIVGGSIARIRGKLATALAAPASVTGTPTTATIDVLRYDSTTGMLTLTGEQEIITNFDPSLTGDIGAYVKAEKLTGVWEPYWVGCLLDDSGSGGGSPVDCQGGYTEYQWDGTEWIVTSNTSVEGCYGPPPDYDGSEIGETVQVPAEPI